MTRVHDQSIRSLKKRLALEGGRGGRPADLRELAVAKIRELKKEGWKQREIAEALGLHQTTVGRYLRGDKRRRGAPRVLKAKTEKRAPKEDRCAEVRPVELKDASATTKVPRARGRTLLLGGGARIEGLSLDDVVELARRLP